MSKINKENIKGLDKEKKEIFKKIIGSATTKIDFNKVRDFYKYGK